LRIALAAGLILAIVEPAWTGSLKEKTEMNIRKTIAAGAAAALLVAGALLAQPPHGHMGHMGHMMDKSGAAGAAGMVDHIASALNLTDAQKASAKQLHQELWTKAQPLMTKMRQQHEELKSLLDGAHPDATEIGQKVIAAHDTRAQLKALHEDFANRFSALLNADQKAKFQEMRQHFEHGDGPGHPAENF
jgi:Spy/CpxP family protein refolding chaperone